jgi:hypothetical protein
MTFKVSSGVALVSEQEFENFRIATIERCAQVAEGFGNIQYVGPSPIAAAIRALKDKP